MLAARYVPSSLPSLVIPGGEAQGRVHLAREPSIWQDSRIEIRMAHHVETPVTGDRVSFTIAFTSRSWARPQSSRSTLRFLGVDALSCFLSGAGLAIEEQFGDWDQQELTDTSPEIITVARRA